jgi:hypothetical protein
MRTTLDIADDVLASAKAIAKEQGKTAGEVLSELARSALYKPFQGGMRNGIPLLPVKDPTARITLELVNALRDDEP